MIPLADARICRLRLRGPDGCDRAVRSDLEEADWGGVAAPGEVLFLRRVRVAGALREVGGLALREARELSAGAVDGTSSAADRAPAVRFTSRATMLACLLRDLLAGRVGARWFWRSFHDLGALPPAEAVPRVLGAEPLFLPAVVGHLVGSSAWPRLWQALDDSGAQQVLNVVQRATGWRVAMSDASDGSEELGPGASQPAASLLPPAWRAVLPARLHRADFRLRLAVAIRLWQTEPRRLGDAPRVVREVAAAIAAEGAAAPSHRPAERTQTAVEGDAETGPAGSSRASPVTVELPAGVPDVADPEAGAAGAEQNFETPRPAGPDGVREEAPAGAPVARSQTARESSVGDESALHRVRAASAEQTAGERPAEPAAEARLADEISGRDEARFVTCRGGWFLLLNALALPAVKERMKSADEPPGLAVGWVWLYRLGRGLGAEPDPALARFLAAEAGLTGPEALATLGPLCCEAELLRLVSARFGESVVNSRLVEAPALVIADSSHVEVHYRLAKVRLDVRRVALDVNPGWLPWLGRVVTFHYGDPAELADLAAAGAQG